MKNIFGRIHLYLNQLFGYPKGHKAKRLNTLCGLITGMIHKGTSSLSVMSSGIIKDIDAASKTKAAKRFVYNPHIDVKGYYLPFIQKLLLGLISQIDKSIGIEIVIDGSNVGNKHACLMISLVWQNRGIPLCWWVREGSKGHFSEANHVALLKEAHELLSPLVPEDMSVILLGDGEFDGKDIQHFCKETAGWSYALRTASNTVFYEDGVSFHARDILPNEGHDTFLIPSVEFTLKRYKWVTFLCYYDSQKYEEPIYLVTNLECAKRITAHYDKRYSIECLFKDLKSTSFHIHKTRLKDTAAINRLLIVACLGFSLLTQFAMKYDQTKNRKRVQRVRNDRKVLSFFTFAYRLLLHFVEYEIDFTFRVDFVKDTV